MKVLVVGFSKTGTKSMNAALQKLGYSVYDYEHNFYYLRKEWIKILTKGGTKEDFYNMYKDVDVSMDIPVCIFWEEILEAFPDTKLIFMRRKNEDDWLRSWERQAQNVDENYMMKFLACFSPTAYSMMAYSQHVARVAFASPRKRFNRAYTDISSTVARKRYRNHNSAVLDRAPKDQMIEFKLSDGWEPLCKFLGKDVPDSPFPHKNQRAGLLDDWLQNSPVFLRMKYEMRVIFSVFVLFLAIGVYFFMFHL